MSRMLVVKEHVPINFSAIEDRLLSKKQGAVEHTSQIKTELKAVDTVRLLRPRAKQNKSSIGRRFDVNVIDSDTPHIRATPHFSLTCSAVLILDGVLECSSLADNDNSILWQQCL